SRSTATRPVAPDRSAFRPARPWPRACPSRPSRCSPACPARPWSMAWRWTSRPRPRWRSRPSGRPRRPAPGASASLLARRCLRQEITALVHRGVEDGHTTVRCGGGNATRVDERLTVDRVRKVLHAVLAYALGEREALLLLLGAPLCTQ